MIDDAHLEAWLREEKTPFEGWDFSNLNGRYFESSLPWSYLDLAAAAVKGSINILDSIQVEAKSSLCSRLTLVALLPLKHMVPTCHGHKSVSCPSV